ncbi:MAG: hypothetical protein KGS72_28960 [Cyanobacteria bacterium REEB67]|nr:hypothetical protein [Cyanobacteria bacterium REEB67]
MSIYIGKLEFEGCFTGLEQIENDPGLYALLLREGDDYQLLEVGENDDVKGALTRRLKGELASIVEGRSFELAVYYTDDLPVAERKELRAEILDEFADEEIPLPSGGNVLVFSR